MTSRNDAENLATALESMAEILAQRAQALRGSAQIVRFALADDEDFAGIPEAEALVALQVRQALDLPELRVLADEAVAAARLVESDEE